MADEAFDALVSRWRWRGGRILRLVKWRVMLQGIIRAGTAFCYTAAVIVLIVCLVTGFDFSHTRFGPKFTDLMQASELMRANAYKVYPEKLNHTEGGRSKALDAVLHRDKSIPPQEFLDSWLKKQAAAEENVE